MNLKNAIKHFHKINKHRYYVCKNCFKAKQYKRGLLHDLSKYSPVEFFESVKYYDGKISPIEKCKVENGWSKAWLHHRGRNKHHWEYWIDRPHRSTKLECFKMPDKYMLESVLDRISASKTYNKDKYTDAEPYEFFVRSKEKDVMNPETAKQIEELLLYLRDNGEKKALAYYKSLYKQIKNNR